MTCLSQLSLDRWQAGELTAVERQAAEAHAAGCPRCRAEHELRTRGFDGLPGADERVLLAGIRRGLERPPLRPWRRWAAGLLAVAAAAGAVALVSLPRREEGVRTKGGLNLRIFRLRAGKPEEMPSGGRFSPGDRLRFVVDLPQEGYVRVLDNEQRGTLSVAWPLEPGVSGRLPGGSEIELPGAVQLDQSAGRETFWLVQCPVSSGEPACKAGGAEPVCPAGCAMTSFVADKQ